MGLDPASAATLRPAVLLPATRAASGAVQHTFPQLSVGQLLEGKVLLLSPSGLATIDTPSGALRLHLPPRFQPGDALTLTVQQTQPKLLLQLTAAQPSAPAQLSPASLALASALSALPERTGPLLLPSSLADTPGLPPAALAGALADALSRSGLFYESHLRAWLEGRKPIAVARQNPQVAAPEGKKELAAEPGLLAAHQLELLERQRVDLACQAWPGQAMQWSIAWDSADDPDRQQEPTSARRWTTELTVTLPHLGTVQARLTLIDGQAAIAFHAPAQASAAILTHASRLQEAMAASGVKIAALQACEDPGDV